MKVAQDGPEQSTPKKSASKNSEAAKRVELLTQKIQIAKELDKLVNAREIFQAKLNLVHTAEADFKEKDGQEWETVESYRVSFEGGTYNKKSLIQFSQRGLIVDFLEFMRAKIEGKISDLDQQILNSAL